MHSSCKFTLDLGPINQTGLGLMKIMMMAQTDLKYLQHEIWLNMKTQGPINDNGPPPPAIILHTCGIYYLQSA